MLAFHQYRLRRSTLRAESTTGLFVIVLLHCGHIISFCISHFDDYLFMRSQWVYSCLFGYR